MDNETTKNEFKFHVLQEQVGTKDLFEEKTHERVACTLEKLICSNEQGLTIGLEGGWGSGKSTVLNLLKEKLASSEDNTLFFVFDAWAHDGDPLRKIFLESLITSIDPQQNDETLNRLREEVSARKKTVSVKTEKSASRLGKWLSLSALFVPFGAALLSATDYKNLLSPFAENAGAPHIPFILGIVFALAPLLTIVYWFWFGDEDESGKRKWDLFNAESEEYYTQDITEDGERTSIEFEKFFKAILSYVFHADFDPQYDRAVLVIDNLDRVDSEYAQNVWSTLQTFFQHRTSSLNGSNEKWDEKLWFLIPHDREGIQRIWRGDKRDDLLHSQELSKSFMEKCFQITVEVPPQVMSAWIDYFEQCVEKALFDWPEKYKSDFVSCYVQCMSKLEFSPSPRQMHSLINKVGLLALQWKNSFTAEAYCLYALCRREMTESEFRQKLLNDEVFTNYPSVVSVEKTNSELAGILFGVNADKGMQLLLFPEIQNCIKERDGEKLRALAEVHNEAFWLVMRACKDRWLPIEQHNDEYKLDVINVLSKAFGNEKNQILGYTIYLENLMLNSIDKWKFDQWSFAESIDSLIVLSNRKSHFLTKLEHGIRARIILCTKSEDFKVKELDELKEMEELLKRHDKPIERKHYPSLDYKKWQAWLIACSEKSVQFDSILPTKEVFKNLIDGAQFNQPTLNGNVFDALRSTYRIHSNNSAWPNLVENLINWFNFPNREFECEEVYAFALEVLRNSTDDQKNRLKDCISGKDFWQAGANSSIDNNPSLKLLVIIADPCFRKHQHINNKFGKYFSSPWSKDELKSLFEEIKEVDELFAIWELAVDEENEFAREIIRNNDDPKLFEGGASKVDEIPWRNEEETRSIIEKLVKNRAFDSISDSISEDPCLYGKVLLLFSKYGNEEVKSKITDILENLSRENWIKAFREHNDILDCVTVKISNFAKAWCDHLSAIISGSTPEPTIEQLSEAVSLKKYVVDLESLYIPMLTEKYFDNKDILSDDSFELLSPFFKHGLNSIKQQTIELQLSNWIEYDKRERVRWLSSLNYDFNNEISETLRADVSTKIKHTSGDELDLYRRLGAKVGIQDVSPENEMNQEKKDD
jgi:hypothetical protein